MFALESAVDEVADRLGIDPLELRLRNHAETDPESGKPWTSKALKALKALKECYRRGADAIGWHERPTGGTVAHDGRVIGYGMATAYEASFRFPATASITIRSDEMAIVETTVSEMGQGLWTGLHTLAAEALGFDPRNVTLRTDTTDLPAGAGAIASTGAYSNGHRILQAAGDLRSKLFALATADPRSDLYRCATASMTFSDNVIHGPHGRRQAVADLMAGHPTGSLSAAATTGRDFGRSALKKDSFGAVFTRVAVDRQLGHIDVQRVVGVAAHRDRPTGRRDHHSSHHPAAPFRHLVILEDPRPVLIRLRARLGRSRNADGRRGHSRHRPRARRIGHQAMAVQRRRRSPPRAAAHPFARPSRRQSMPRWRIDR